MKKTLLFLYNLLIVNQLSFSQSVTIVPSNPANPTAGTMDYNNSTNQLQYWNSAAWIPITNAASGTGWALNGNHIYSSNTGFVGIGTSTPTEKLSIVNGLPGYGVTHTYGPVTMGTYISNLYGQFGTKTNHPLQFFTNNGNAQMTILQNGNVGIGETSPGTKLEIVDSGIGVATLRVKNTASFSTIDIDAATGDAALRFYHNGVYKWNVRNSNLDNFQIFDSNAGINNIPKFMIENGTGNIGFKTNTPQSNLHIDPSGAGSILIGKNRNTGGFTNLEMGISAQSNGQSFIQSTKASGSTWGTLQLNPSGGDVTVAGNVGIGTNTPNYPLDIVQADVNDVTALRILTPGDIWGMGVYDNLFFVHNTHVRAIINKDDGHYTTFSDKRLKKNIEEINPVLDKVLKLKAKNYQFIDSQESTKKSIGFISQEVIDLFPELVSSSKRSVNDSTLYYGLNYAGFSVIAIKAIQEQQQIIDDLRARLEAIEKRLK